MNLAPINEAWAVWQELIDDENAYGTVLECYCLSDGMRTVECAFCRLTALLRTWEPGE